MATAKCQLYTYCIIHDGCDMRCIKRRRVRIADAVENVANELHGKRHVHDSHSPKIINFFMNKNNTYRLHTKAKQLL